MKTRLSAVTVLVLATAVASLADGLPADVPTSDTYVSWLAGPCTEPVLLVPTDKENVRQFVPAAYPGTSDDFMSKLVTTVGTDGRAKATVVFTLNRCRNSSVTRVIDGVATPTTTATNVSEVLVMVLWDGASSNAFEFYAIASYIDEPHLAAAYRSLGLPSQHTPGLVFQLDADPEAPSPGATLPFHVAIPDAFRVDGTVVRPLTYGPAGHATHHYHGARGEIWVEHDSPTGGVSTSEATITVTGASGAWLAALLGTRTATGRGMLLEKHVGHHHDAYLVGP